MIITIAHTKGGAGKSTLALHLTSIIKDSKLIDADIQQSSFKINGFLKKPMEVFSAKTKDELISFIENKKEKETLLIDVGGHDSVINRLAIANADICLVPLKDSAFEFLEAVEFYRNSISAIKSVSDVKFLAVLNNVHIRTKNFSRLERFISSAENFTLLADSIVRNRAAYVNLLEEGKTVNDSKYSPAFKEIKKLHEEIKKYA